MTLPRVGHDDPDLRDCGAPGADPVRSDPVPDDGALTGRDDGVGVVPT
jgi:hypothetical protein